MDPSSPATGATLARAQARLRWDEAFGVQVLLAQRRLAVTAAPAVPRPGRPGGLRDAFDARLPFELTAGQREVGEEIDGELGATHPMHRLLQGEVGSGKTVVALRAMLQVVDSGGQAALLAPTEVLAAQHARTHRRAARAPRPGRHARRRDADATRVALLTGSLTAAARRAALLDGRQRGRRGSWSAPTRCSRSAVQFADLGLVVVDEQHRFGVEQRAALRREDRRVARPHILVMTATPIPRTVAMTVFGDLEVVDAARAAQRGAAR